MSCDAGEYYLAKVNVKGVICISNHEVLLELVDLVVLCISAFVLASPTMSSMCVPVEIS